MVCLRLHTRKSVNVISASARKLIILPLPLLSGLPHTDVEVIMSQTAQKPQFDNIQLDSNSDLRIFYIVSAFKPFLSNLSLIPILLLTSKWFCATQRKSQSNWKTILQTTAMEVCLYEIATLNPICPG